MGGEQIYGLPKRLTWDWRESRHDSEHATYTPASRADYFLLLLQYVNGDYKQKLDAFFIHGLPPKKKKKRKSRRDVGSIVWDKTQRYRLQPYGTPLSWKQPSTGFAELPPLMRTHQTTPLVIKLACAFILTFVPYLYGMCWSTTSRLDKSQSVPGRTDNSHQQSVLTETGFQGNQEVAQRVAGLLRADSVHR